MTFYPVLLSATLREMNASAPDKKDSCGALIRTRSGEAKSHPDKYVETLTRSRSGGARPLASLVHRVQIDPLTRNRSGEAKGRSDSLLLEDYVETLTGRSGKSSPKIFLNDQGLTTPRARSAGVVPFLRRGKQITISSPPRDSELNRFDFDEFRPPLLESSRHRLTAYGRTRSDEAKVGPRLIGRVIDIGVRSHSGDSKRRIIEIGSLPQTQQPVHSYPIKRSTSGELRDVLNGRLNCCKDTLKNAIHSPQADRQEMIESLREEQIFMKTQVDEYLHRCEERFKSSPQESKEAKPAQVEIQKAKLKTNDLVHELRAPLNGIGGYLDLLELELTDAERTEAIQGLLESYKHLGEVLKNDITDSEEIDLKLNEQEFTVNQVFQRVGSNTKMTDPKVKVEFKFFGDDLNTQLTGDFLKICKILINLTNNGIKYSEKPGTVLIQVRASKNEDGTNTLRFFVRDKGPGMSEQFMKTGLFQKFSKGEKAENSKQNASGLGLYLSQQFAEAMHSKIEVVSNQPRKTLDAEGREVCTNIGTVFHFELKLPIYIPKPATVQEEKQNGPLQGKSFLVIEDEKTTQNLYDKWFQKACAKKVVIVPDGDEALARYTKEGPFHAIISDQNVQGTLKGLDVAARIQEIAKRTKALSPPFILCTGDNLEEEVNRVKESLPPVFDVFTKPIRFPLLIKTLAERVSVQTNS